MASGRCADDHDVGVGGIAEHDPRAGTPRLLDPGAGAIALDRDDRPAALEERLRQLQPAPAEPADDHVVARDLRAHEVGLLAEHRDQRGQRRPGGDERHGEAGDLELPAEPAAGGLLEVERDERQRAVGGLERPLALDEAPEAERQHDDRERRQPGEPVIAPERAGGGEPATADHGLPRKSTRATASIPRSILATGLEP